MNIQEILQKFTNEDKTIDYDKVNKFIENETMVQVGAVKSKALSKQQEELQRLAKENEELKSFNENFKSQEEYYKGKIQEMTEQYNNASSELNTMNLHKKAEEYNVSEDVIKSLIESGADLSKVDLTPFHNTKKPKLNEDDKDDEEEVTQGAFTEEDVINRALEMAEEE